jgi:hypothetical protein
MFFCRRLNRVVSSVVVPSVVHSHAELDSHADTCAFGDSTFIIQDTTFQSASVSWWVPFTLKQRDRIIKAMKKRYFCQFSKFGLELPKTVQRIMNLQVLTLLIFLPKHRLVQNDVNCVQRFFVEVLVLPAGQRFPESGIRNDLKLTLRFSSGVPSNVQLILSQLPMDKPIL